MKYTYIIIILLFIVLCVIKLYIIRLSNQDNIIKLDIDYKWDKVLVTNVDEYPDHITSTGHKSRLINEDPKMEYIEDFLTKREIDHIIGITNDRFNRSTTDISKIDSNSKNDTLINSDRTSFTAFLEKSETKIISNIEKKAAKLAGVKVENLESLQVLKYSNGQYYKPHYDYFNSESIYLKQGGQRIKSIFVYLNKLPDSSYDIGTGGTVFPILNKKIVPKKAGDAFMWNNVDFNGEPDPRTLHSGEPVKNGTKYAINIWIRKGIYNKNL